MKTIHNSAVASAWCVTTLLILTVLVPVESRATLYTYQQDISGYTSTSDDGLREEAPTSNEGVTQSMGTGQDTTVKRYLVLRFDDIFGPGSGQVPAGQAISAASLTLTTTLIEAGAMGGSLRASPMLVSWDQNSVTWRDREFDNVLEWGPPANNGPVAGTDYDSTIFASATVPSTVGDLMTWDITSIVSSWYAGSPSNNGLLIYDSNLADGARVVRFGASEFVATPSTRPLLSITAEAIPEPSMIGLLAVSGLMLWWRVRTRR